MSDSASSVCSSGVRSVLIGIRQPGPDVALAAPIDLAQPVQGQTGGDGGQPTGRVDDGAPVRPRPSQPGFLHDVLGVGPGRDQTVGHTQQPGTLRLEDADGLRWPGAVGPGRVARNSTVRGLGLEHTYLTTVGRRL